MCSALDSAEHADSKGYETGSSNNGEHRVSNNHIPDIADKRSHSRGSGKQSVHSSNCSDNSSFPIKLMDAGSRIRT